VTEQQLLRMAKRHLAILRLAEEVTGHVALTCRYDGISRAGVLHLAPALRPARLRRASGAPGQSNATRTEVVGKIIYLASATSATTAADSASRSRCPATACRST